MGNVDNMVVLGASMAGGLALTYYMTKREKPIDPYYDFENQSVEIDKEQHIRVCPSVKGKSLTEYRFEDVRTLFDVLPKGLVLSSDGPCVGQREGPGKGPYIWMKYSEVIEKIRSIGSGLIFKGIESSNSSNIGIYSSNRNEWIISEHACYSFSFPVVSLYDSYGKDSIRYILNHAELRAIFVDTFSRIMNLLEVIDHVSHLKLIIHFNQFSESENKIIEKYRHKIAIVHFETLLEIGRKNLIPPNPPKPSDIATVCYTSGTTGNPKGALLSHGNIIANEAAINERLNQPHLNFLSDDPPVVHMSYLPLAHMLERQASMMVFLAGGRLGFLSGDITCLISDAQELKPRDFPIVPRLLNKLYDSVSNQIKGSSVKQFLLKRAIAAKEADRKRGIYRKDTLYDKLVFNKIRERLGGRICRMATGSAPISDEVMIFSKAAFSCPIPEGYGQTEATCSVTFTHPFDVKLGHCGPPVSCYMVKLVDVPEMNYFACSNQGEICCKGPSVFKGYLKDEEKTNEAIDKDGWLHTGDIGMWLSNGCLKIIDRKKNLFKLSQGEYISPEKIENIYLRSQFVAQIIIEGNSLKDFVVGIVVPDIDYLREHFKNPNLDLKTFCSNQSSNSLVMNDLELIGKNSGLMSYEKVKKIHLHPELMSLENGLATPTMKIKRAQVRIFFGDVIRKMYNEPADLRPSSKI
ncbi:long-chain-fatty-acid-- ligase 5 [Brachionus plicatilis]|uniref:Long-chain-fatty-acid--CoA ligase n=1 Tax=Brachionus plicatilis TaxID=10195 RepID=A0A3M7RKM2_BRAPC|nr:long-chain-fatty-acid-- ligase 5 [Brachionus plicatilis]